MKVDVLIKYTLIVWILLIMSISTICFEYAKAQDTSSTDPKQLLKEFKTGKDVIQKDVQVNLNELISQVKTQMNFSSVDSHLSLASQYLLNGKISEGLAELRKANETWQNSSMTIINEGNDFISVAKNNSIAIDDSTREILDHFGNILVSVGNKLDNLRIELSN